MCSNFPTKYEIDKRCDLFRNYENVKESIISVRLALLANNIEPTKLTLEAVSQLLDECFLNNGEIPA